MPRPRTVDDRALLSAAGRAMGRHGPADLTLAAVAAEAGVSAATLVQRFGSKHGLIRAVGEDAATTAHEAFARHTAHPLTALLDAYAATVASVAHAEMGNHIAHLGQDASHPDLRAAAADQARVLRTETAALLREALDAGHLRPDTDVERLARAIYLTFNGALIAWALDGGADTAADAVRTDLAFVLSVHTTGETS